jgi:putative ATPase
MVVNLHNTSFKKETSSIFSYFCAMANQPLAERLRPKTLDNYLGQDHLVGKNAILRKMIENNTLSSMILWGPPGVGKTTLAQIIAQTLERPFIRSVP